MEPLPSISGDLLLRQSSGLRALARGLLRDEHAAEEVVQETFAASVAAPPSDAARVGGWLARVTRRKAVKRRWSDARRRAREEQASRPEALASTDEVVAQREVLRLVVDAVLGLAEPYQSVVLLRYFEDLPPREIARRRGAKVGTVNSQLQRALAMLRGRLDAEAKGERGQWAFALAAVTGGARGGAGTGGPPGPSATLARRAGEAIAMHWKLSIGLAGALMVGLGYTSRPGLEARDTEETAERAQAEAGGLASEVAEARQEPAQVPGAALDERVALGAAGAGAAEGEDAGRSACFELELLVVDEHDVPVAGQAVIAAPLGHPPNLFGSTGWDGRLRIAFPAHAPTLALALQVPRGLAARRVELRAGEPASLRLVARRSSSFVVRPSANVAVPPRESKPREPGEADEAIVAELKGLGHVEVLLPVLDVAPLASPLQAGGGLSLFAWPLPPPTADHDEDAELVELVDETAGGNAAAMPSSGTYEVLESLGYVDEVTPEPPTRRVTVGGLVLDAAGEPARKARIEARSGGNLRTLCTDAEGAFTVELQALETLELSAGGGDLGLAAASFPLDRELQHQQITWNPRLDRGLEVRGRLRLPEGVDASDWLVLFEAGPERALHQDATLTRDGRFAIPNLPAGAGRLFVLQREQDAFARRVFEGVLPGGAELELALEPRDLASGTVALRVTDADGEALAAAEVMLWQPDSRRGAPLGFHAEEQRHQSGALPPGRYRAIAGTPVHGYRDLGELDVLADELTDLGVVALARSGRLQLPAEALARCAEAGLVLMRAETRSPIYGAAWAPGGTLELPAGEYALVEPARAAGPARHSLRVEAGETAVLALEQR